MSLLRASARLGHELVRMGVDTLTPAALPRRAAHFVPGQLGAILGCPLSTVEPVAGTSGTTDRALLRLEGPGTSRTVFVKTAAADRGTRLFGSVARLGEVEVGFYRDLRPALEIEAPQVRGSRFDPWTGRFVIVLDDLAVDGAQFVDTLTPLSVEQAAAALSTLAALHGQSSGAFASGRARPRWLTTNGSDAVLPLVAAILPRLARVVAERTPEHAVPGGARLLGSYRHWAPVLDADAWCVLHGDPHPGNLYLLQDRVGLLDWQAVRWGNGVRDATYLLVLALEAEVRRESERDLLDHYRSALRAHGGPEVTAEAMWTTYRRMAAYVYVATTFTSGLGGLQGAAIADTGLARSVAAAVDLETFAAMEADLP